MLEQRAREAVAGRVGAASDDGIEVRDAIERLDPELAEIVRLVHWEGLSLAAVAEITGTPAGTVRTRYRRARERLRAVLA